MRKQKLITPDQLRCLISYDPETGQMTWLPRGIEWFHDCQRPEHMMRVWNKKHAGKPALNTLNNGYRQSTVYRGGVIKAHHAAWAIYYGEWPPGQLDHINRIRDDNRIANLRLATESQNSANRRHSSPYPMGVCPRPNGKWMARIKKNGKSIYLGQFDTAEEAGRAYQEAAQEIHGEFAIRAA